MLVQISLNLEKNLPVWFLGPPRPTPKVILSLEEPGPVSIDFAKLTESEQRHILLGLQREHLVADLDFDSLYDQHLKSFPVKLPPPPEVQTYLEGIEKKKSERVVLNEFNKREIEETKRVERCESVIKLPMKSLKAIILTIDDIKTLRMLNELELKKPTKKQRQAVLELLQTKIRKIHAAIEDSFARSSAAPPLMDPYDPYAKIELVVEEEIPVDPEGLAEFAAR